MRIRMERAPHRTRNRKRHEFTKAQKFSAQICSYTSGNENTRCKGSIGKRLRNFRRHWRKFRNKQEVIAEARNKGLTVHFCIIVGSLSSQEFGVGATISKIQKVELYSEVTLWKMIQDYTKCWLNKDHQHFAGDIEDANSTSGGLLCTYGSHAFVPVSWDVQETDINFSQLTGSGDNFSWRRFTHGWNFRAWSLGFGQRWEVAGKRVANHHTPHGNNKIQRSTSIWIWTMLITFRQKWDHLDLVLCYMSLRTMKPWLRL